MTTLLLAGAGAVAVRTARQLVDTPGVDRLLVTARHSSRASELAAALSIEAIPYGTLPDHVDGVALAVPGNAAAVLARQAVERGIPVAAGSDDADGITSLLALDAAARERGSTVVVGCALVPGLADILARHAADALERADEIYVARFGTAGESCAATVRRARRERAVEWRDGEARTVRRVGPELVWFPDPVGAQECVTIAGGVELLHAAVPSVTRATVRAAEPAVPRRRSPLARRRAGNPWGAARVEVWGWRDGTRAAVVYGVIEQPAVAAATVLAVASARAAGLLPDLRLRVDSPGAHALAELVEPAPFLAELARRGVKAAVFEGVATS